MGDKDAHAERERERGRGRERENDDIGKRRDKRIKTKEIKKGRKKSWKIVASGLNVNN